MSDTRAVVADDVTTTDGPAVTIQEDTVRVSLFGSNEVSITVEAPGSLTIEDVLVAAAELLKVKLDKTRVGADKNGEPAKLDATVAAGDFVSGAPRASNG